MKKSLQLLVVFLLIPISSAALSHTPGRAARSSDGGCSLSGTSGTTEACYVHYVRDDSSATGFDSLPAPDFNPCESPNGNKTCFFLQYANDGLTTQRGCNGSSPFMVLTPSSGATGGDAAVYAMIYGAMISDRLIVLTVENCVVTGAKLVETPVRNFH